MAEKIQSEVVVVHTIEEPKPTSNESPTKIGSKKDVVGEEEESATKKLLGATSFKRRITNYSIAGAERAYNSVLDQRIFKETLYGDSRTVRKIQNQKTNFNLITGEVKSIVGVTITSVALGNPYLLALQGIDMISRSISIAETRTLERQNFIEKTNIELFVQQKRRDRLNIGTYNRRW